MKCSTNSILASLVGIATAHSWVECTNHDNSQLLPLMREKAQSGEIIDPTFYPEYCHGWPRGKQNPGNWIDESTYYVWNIAAESFKGDTNACNPSQRHPNQASNAPIARASAGSMIRLRYGGNGHARGAPMGDAGTVAVYWKGSPGQEIVDIGEFNDQNRIASQGFSDNAFSFPQDPNIVSPDQGLVDKGNWMDLYLPGNMQPGVHMMAWVWSYQGAPQWSTCFDVEIS